MAALIEYFFDTLISCLRDRYHQPLVKLLLDLTSLLFLTSMKKYLCTEDLKALLILKKVEEDYPWFRKLHLVDKDLAVPANLMLSYWPYMAKYASEKLVDTHLEALLTIDKSKFFNKELYEIFQKTFEGYLYGQ